MEAYLDTEEPNGHDTCWDELKTEWDPPNIHASRDMNTNGDYRGYEHRELNQRVGGALTIDEVGNHHANRDLGCVMRSKQLNMCDLLARSP